MRPLLKWPRKRPVKFKVELEQFVNSYVNGMDCITQNQ